MKLLPLPFGDLSFDLSRRKKNIRPYLFGIQIFGTGQADFSPQETFLRMLIYRFGNCHVGCLICSALVQRKFFRAPGEKAAWEKLLDC